MIERNGTIKMKRKIYITLTIIWMIIIFCFSARNGVTSTGDSHYIGMKVGEVFVPGFEQWSEQRQLAFAQKADFPIRKSAHAMEYALLGFLFAGAVSAKTKEQGKQDDTRKKISKIKQNQSIQKENIPNQNIENKGKKDKKVKNIISQDKNRKNVSSQKETIQNKTLYLAAWIGSAMYAMTDELHQLFVPGRSGRIADVLLDSTGAAVGVCFFLIIQRWKKNALRK